MSEKKRRYMKRNDTRPDLVVQLTDAEENALDLSEATTKCYFHMWRQETSFLKVAATATTAATAGLTGVGADGKVRHVWSTGDTDTTGRYDAEFEVVWPGGGIQTFPVTETLEVVITDDLEDD